ncbi:MAG: phosphodiester glycosidase family protein [Lachnospiraceae bacterium]|nr:phosphodiester glycosidase family protein [Lachnospiraceae bacterium]
MKKFLNITGKFFLWLFVTLILILAGFLVMIYMVSKGPSEQIRNLFVTSVRETSAAGFLADIFLTDDEVVEIMSSNVIEVGEISTDTQLFDFTEDFGEPDEESADIEIEDVKGALYRGKMMIVKDPSRVKVGTCDAFDKNTAGLTLLEIIDKYDAIAGINGGRYNDDNGFGKGGQPEGIVFSEGELVYGELDQTYNIYGFDKNNVFICGTMTGQKAIDMGFRDAVTFGPALVVNGEAVSAAGTGGGLNPRTAIGQRADGAVLLLVIEGRQTSSMGASYLDLIEIMLDYGAVNAANLDGGMSSSMAYEGEEILNNCSIKGPRDMPTAFIVER